MPNARERGLAQTDVNSVGDPDLLQRIGSQPTGEDATAVIQLSAGLTLQHDPTAGHLADGWTSETDTQSRPQLEPRKASIRQQEAPPASQAANLNTSSPISIAQPKALRQAQMEASPRPRMTAGQIQRESAGQAQRVAEQRAAPSSPVAIAMAPAPVRPVIAAEPRIVPIGGAPVLVVMPLSNAKSSEVRVIPFGTLPTGTSPAPAAVAAPPQSFAESRPNAQKVTIVRTADLPANETSSATTTTTTTIAPTRYRDTQDVIHVAPSVAIAVGVCALAFCIISMLSCFYWLRRRRRRREADRVIRGRLTPSSEAWTLDASGEISSPKQTSTLISPNSLRKIPEGLDEEAALNVPQRVTVLGPPPPIAGLRRGRGKWRPARMSRFTPSEIPSVLDARSDVPSEFLYNDKRAKDRLTIVADDSISQVLGRLERER